MKFLYRFSFLKSLGLLCLLIFGANAQRALASHGMGADITYACVGPNQYRVFLTFFRDCSGISPDTAQTLRYRSLSCGVDASVPIPKSNVSVDVTPICPSELSNCAGGTSSFGIEQHTYETVIQLPPGCGNDWVLEWQQCCRNFSITTLNNPGNQDLLVTAELNNTIAPCNSSPVFNNIPTPIVCDGIEVIYNHGVTDPDGDSLAFSLVNCLTDDAESVPYANTFSPTAPLATLSGVNVNAQTGELRFTPAGQQIGVICVLVEEFRNGVKIGEVVRDMQFSVVNCSNTPPVSSGIDGGGDYTISVCKGGNLCFDMFMSDTNGDNIEVAWNRGIRDGTFTVTDNGTAAPSANFCWATDEDDVGTHFFTVEVKDDACLLRGSRIYTYIVEVFETTNTLDAGADQTICPGGTTSLSATSSGATSYLWTPSTGLSDPTSPTPTVAPGINTVYTLTASFPDGCEISDFTRVSISDLPDVSVAPATRYICPGGTVTLTADAPQAVSYTWSTGATTPSVDVSPASTSQYVVTVEDAIGCISTDTATVRVNEPAANGCIVVYASPNGTGAGTPGDPASLQDAISLASCSNSIIKLAIGTYVLDEPIASIGSDLTLEGGFDPANNWRKTSAAGATTLFRTAANPEGTPGQQRIVAIYMNGATDFRFQDLTIETDDAIDPGTSTYGVHLTNCADYQFVRCQIMAGNAADGVDGMDGDDGVNGENGENGTAGDNDDQDIAGNGGGGGAGGGVNAGNGGAPGIDNNDGRGGNCCFSRFFPPGPTSCCQNGPLGAAGGDAADVRAGGGGGGGAAGGEGPSLGGTGGDGGVNFSGAIQAADGGQGGNNGNTGQGGTFGENGANGTIGAPGTDGLPGGHVSGFWQPGTPGDDGDDGFGGQGGGGGGGGGGQSGGGVTNGGGNGGGGGGGGGQGGSGGTGGTGGGSSYAIYLFNNGANSVFNSCMLLAGTAGLGGQGGQGGIGGQGGLGGLGSTLNIGEVGRGGNGGDGGDGGNGGDGGDGQPGQAIALFQGAGSTAPIVQDITFNLAAQTEIFMENISCVNKDVNFSSIPNGDWDLGPDASQRTFVNTNTATTQFVATGRKDIRYAGQLYSDFANIELPDNPLPQAAASARLDGNVYYVCQGEAADLEALNGGFNYTYRWDLDNAVTPNTFEGTEFQSLTNLTFDTPGTYEIQLQYETDCCGLSQIDTITLVVEPQPVLALAGDTATCKGGGGVTLTASGGSSYLWAPATGLNSTTDSTVIANPPADFTYTVTAFNASGACSDEAEITVDVNELELSSLAVDALCGNNGAAEVIPSGGSGDYSFLWNTSPAITQGEAVGLAPGAYNVRVEDNITGCVDSLGIFVGAAPSNLTVGPSSLTPTSCATSTDGAITLAVTGGQGPYLYSWENNVGTGNTATNLPAGKYGYSVEDQNGCLITDTVEVAAPSPVVVALLDSTNSSCNNFGEVWVNASGGDGPYNYEWTQPSLNDSSFTTGLTPDTVYTVTATDQKGCTGTLDVSLPGPASPVAIVIDTVQDASLCTAADGRIVSSASGGDGNYTFVWTGDGILAPGSPVQENLTPGAYDLLVIDGNNCTDMAVVTIEPECPLPVTLLDFRAQPRERHIQLDWVTEEEFQNAGFEVQRSTEGDHLSFQPIGWVDSERGRGAAYQFDDLDVRFNTPYHYRLRQVDVSGGVHFSEVRTARLDAQDYLKVVRVYPTPTTREVSIDLQLPFVADISLQLVNALGQQALGVQEFEGEAGLNTLTVDLADLAAGIYYGKLLIQQQYELDVKLIKSD